MAETSRAFEVGVSLSSEEQGPAALVRVAHRAEELGFGFAMISDHFHPWIDQQGQSPFVWSVLGAIAQATERLRIGAAATTRWRTLASTPCLNPSRRSWLRPAAGSQPSLRAGSGMA